MSHTSLRDRLQAPSLIPGHAALQTDIQGAQLWPENLEISYLYRDAANYKQCVSVVVSNPQALTAEQVKAALLQHFAADQVWPDILHFRPEDLGWPTVFFDDHDEDGDDLSLHELEKIEPTDAAETEDCELPDWLFSKG